MQQYRERIRRSEGWPPAASRRGEFEAARGRILELPDQPNLPPRDRLSRMDGDWRESIPPTFGQIVEDRLDGRRVYPMPPHRPRAVHLLRRLLKRATPPMLFFILLAAAQAGTAVADSWSGRDLFASVVGLATGVGYACTLTLLPAAVLIWGSAAERSFKLLLAGAIAWSTLPAMADLAWWIVRRSPSLMDQFGYAAATAVAVAAVISFTGPAVVAFGLERARRGRITSASDMARLVAGVASLIVLARAAGWASIPDSRAIPQVAWSLDSLHLAATVESAALPLELACLLILAYSCLSAVFAEDVPSRFWRCAAAGAVLLAAAGFYRIMTGDLLGPSTPSVVFGAGWGTAPATASQLAGGGLMLLAFAVPVWSAVRGVVCYGRAAPEEIFAWGGSSQSASSQPIPMSTIAAVAAGTDHALALDVNGRVCAWGDDSVSQVDVPEGLSGVIAVAAGDGFSLALRSDGTVAAWGANNLGQTRVPPNLTGITSIAAGRGFALALSADGTVVGWGDGDCGATPVPSWLTEVASVSAGEYHAVALLRHGVVVAWGDNTCGQLDVPRGLGPARAVSAGGDFCLALLADGTVAAWGDNTYGQLDVPAGLANVTAISAGAFHAVALRADGDVLAWGGGGQRKGEAEHPWRLVDFKAVSAGDGFSLAIRAG